MQDSVVTITGSERQNDIDTAITLLSEGRLFDPFSVLGRHDIDGRSVIRAFVPNADAVFIHYPSIAMKRIASTAVFEYCGNQQIPDHYRLFWQEPGKHHHHSSIDPYSFSPQISSYDLHLFGEGTHRGIYQLLGANHHQVDGIDGVLFAVWAPNAERVSVVGDFNQWDGLRYPMRSRGSSGIWELFIPDVNEGDCYKFELRNRLTGNIEQKLDVYARAFELRPKTASVIKQKENYQWRDQQWQQHRQHYDWAHSPVSIYELHPGSWRRHEDGRFLTYRELAEQLVPYISSMGFTHIELLPITEHPFDGSWGYQTLGYYAPTSRFGSPEDFCFFVDICHQHGIGVLLDWVVSHFPKDTHGICQYDGTALYEHADPQKAEHQDWGTLIFNYARNEVKNFLIANALFWCKEFHIDGLRVDAVASMLYLDYSRQPGQWTPNQYGGNENLEAVSFLQELNEQVHARYPGVMMIAEESTSWPQVSRPTYLGGLGFSMKWNMGWMHDTLSYISHDPVHRRYHHDQLTFGMLYAYTENFVLALSHDEVVHEKASLLHKMPGDDWQKFANIRLLYTYMFTYPGKKLLFMGNEFCQRNEWDHDTQLDWPLLDYLPHQGAQLLVSDLNHLYKQQPALYVDDFDRQGFQWIDCHDSDQSVLSYLRRTDQHCLIIVLNFTPVPRSAYRLGVPAAHCYRERINSDSRHYGGSDLGNGGVIAVDTKPWMGFDHSIEITLPPLAALVLEPSC